MKSEYAAYSVPVILVNAGLYIYLWVTAIRFFEKRSVAPQRASVGRERNCLPRVGRDWNARGRLRDQERGG